MFSHIKRMKAINILVWINGPAAQSSSICSGKEVGLKCQRQSGDLIINFKSSTRVFLVGLILARSHSFESQQPRPSALITVVDLTGFDYFPPQSLPSPVPGPVFLLRWAVFHANFSEASLPNPTINNLCHVILFLFHYLFIIPKSVLQPITFSYTRL